MCMEISLIQTLLANISKPIQWSYIIIQFNSAQFILDWL